MRFLSSSAFARAPKFRLDAIVPLQSLAVAPNSAPRLWGQAAVSPLFHGGADRDRAAGLLDRATAHFDAPTKTLLWPSIRHSEQPHAVPGAAQHAGSPAPPHRPYRRCRAVGVDRRWTRSRLTSLSLIGNGDEAALGRRRCGIWPPSKPLRHAGARGLALAATAAGLADARADAASDADALLVRPCAVGDLVELHDLVPTSPRPRGRGAAPCRSCRASPDCPAIP
jgi:hypothetical protein